MSDGCQIRGSSHAVPDRAVALASRVRVMEIGGRSRAQVYLPDGSIFVEGYGSVSPNGPARLELPIVGGTRIYSNARRYVKVRDISGGRTLLDFHVEP